jgi:hypothetical protein
LPSGSRIRYHLPIARLEDVERQVRFGKEYDRRERKQRNAFRNGKRVGLPSGLTARLIAFRL